MVTEPQMREDVPVEETWDLTDLFQTRDDFLKEIERFKKEYITIDAYRGKLNEGPETFLECLLTRDALTERMVRLVTYASLRVSADGTDPENQHDAAIATSLLSEFSASISFIESEILSLSEGRIEEYFNQEQGLKDFQKQLQDLMESKPHRLSDETEEALASFNEIHNAPFTIYQQSLQSDMTFPSFRTSDGKEFPLTFNNYPKYEESPDTEIRRKAYDAFIEGLNKYKNTYAATFATEVKKNIIEAKFRKFESATDMLLHQQQVTKDMYENLLNTIFHRLAPHMRRYAKLKERVLGLEKIHYCDLKAPLVTDVNLTVTYEEAARMILDAVEIMGVEYKEIIKEGLENRWVDWADNIGKRSGAFCSSPYGVHPYILMTWNDSMRNVYTLAHELGHAVHFVLAGRNQRISNTRPSRYFIEAPSTMNERLLSHHLLKTTDPKMKRWIILESLGTYYHNFVTHLLEGELQRRIYEQAEQGIPVTTQLLCKLNMDVLADFWGDAVELDEGASLTWMRQPHYYMGLYSYTYSAGLTASTIAAKRIEVEGKPAVERWLSVLKAGGTLKPVDLMKLAGIDMTIPEPIEEAVDYVGSLIDELEKSFSE